MFCPFCKAEYRQGFSTCNDCHIALVATQEEAAAVEVDRLWTGDDRERLTGILDALPDADIPFRSIENLKSQAWPWISILLFRFMKPRPTFEYRIDILHSDRDRADAVIPKPEVMMNKSESLARLTCSSRARSSLCISMEMKNVDRID